MAKTPAETDSMLKLDLKSFTKELLPRCGEGIGEPQDIAKNPESSLSLELER
jgi:hypothetical protein